MCSCRRRPRHIYSAWRRCRAAHSHTLFAREPFFGRFRNAVEQCLEVRPIRPHHKWLGQPAYDLTSGDSHTVHRTGMHRFVEVLPEHQFDHFPGILSAKLSSNVRSFQHFEAFRQRLAGLNAQHIDIAVGRILHVIAQIQASTAHNSNRAKGWIGGSMANDLANAFVAPVFGRFSDEMPEQSVKLWSSACPLPWIRASVPQYPFVRTQAITHVITQNVMLIEAIQAISAITT